MDRRVIAMVWLGGILLMVVVYVTGPEHFIASCEQFVIATLGQLNDLIGAMMDRAFEAVRAAAIALYVVFVALAVLAMRRRQPAGGMLIWVSVVFLLLVRTNWYDPGTEWFTAAVLVAIAALVLTRRLVYAPRLRDPADPWALQSGNDRAGLRRAPPQPPP